MLDNKDYCDYETCVALKELGYKGISRFFYATKESPLRRYSYDQILTTRIADAVGHTLAISLYVAQKWLREEKKLIVLVGFDFCPITSEIVYNWVIVVNGNTAKKSSYTYEYFEEALSEGVREAIKILKENE